MQVFPGIEIEDSWNEEALAKAAKSSYTEAERRASSAMFINDNSTASMLSTPVLCPHKPHDFLLVYPKFFSDFVFEVEDLVKVLFSNQMIWESYVNWATRSCIYSLAKRRQAGCSCSDVVRPRYQEEANNFVKHSTAITPYF